MLFVSLIEDFNKQGLFYAQLVVALPLQKMRHHEKKSIQKPTLEGLFLVLIEDLKKAVCAAFLFSCA